MIKVDLQTSEKPSDERFKSICRITMKTFTYILEFTRDDLDETTCEFIQSLNLYETIFVEPQYNQNKG